MNSRRKFLKNITASAIALPLLLTAACGGSASEPSGDDTNQALTNGSCTEVAHFEGEIQADAFDADLDAFRGVVTERHFDGEDSCGVRRFLRKGLFVALRGEPGIGGNGFQPLAKPIAGRLAARKLMPRAAAGFGPVKSISYGTTET